jgi:mannitol/fructose-specific phosphotransferase system IIA component (Ntr-type)
MSELFSNENIFINVSVGSQNEAIEKAGQALVVIKIFSLLNNSLID